MLFRSAYQEYPVDKIKFRCPRAEENEAEAESKEKGKEKNKTKEKIKEK